MFNDTANIDVEKVFKRLMDITGAKIEQDLADALGEDRAALNARKRRGSPPYPAIVKAAIKYHRSVDWILWGDIAKTDFVSVPLVEARLSAGGGSLENSSQIIKSYAFRSEWLSAHGDASKMALMRVSGDSMEPKIHNGDMVLIDLSQTHCRAGQIYAVAIEDLIYLKRVDTAPGELILKSENPNFDPIRISTSEDNAEKIKIIGKCIWLCREI